MSELKRFLLSFLLSMSLILLWQKFFPTKKESQASTNEIVLEKKAEKTFITNDFYQIADNSTVKKLDIPLFENFYKQENDFISFEFS